MPFLSNLISCGAVLTAKITTFADIYFLPNFSVLPFQCFVTFLILVFWKRSAEVLTFTLVHENDNLRKSLFS